ncbi:MAG: hypothetical protein WAX79_01730 [Candidatus Omnitrophota bacterium]
MLQTISSVYTLETLLLVIILTWHYALRCGFISDDHAIIAQRKDIIPDTEKHPGKEKYWVKVFNDGVIMYYWNRIMDKLHLRPYPVIWHALCLGIHLLNCYLLYLVLIPFLGQQKSIIAVMFWAVNPMLNQNVVWISGRPYLIALLCALTSLLCWDLPLIVLPLYTLGVITNISIALLPLLIKLMHKGWQANLYILMMFVVGVPFILWKFHRRFTTSLVLDRENFKFKKRKITTIMRIYGYYIKCFFLPVTMGWYHQSGFRYNPKWEKFNVWALVSYILVIWLAFQGWPGWWYILGILPNANMFATNSFVQDRYMYFGSIGLSILCVPLFIKYPVLFIAAISIYASKAYSYSRALQNDEAMYRENWRNHPESDYAVNNLSFFLIQQKRYDEARVVILRGLEICRSNKMLWYNLGVTWAAQGNFTNDECKFRFLKAVDCWKMALQIEPRWAKPAEDLKKMIQILVDQKVITMDINQAVKDAPAINLPAVGGFTT